MNQYLLFPSKDAVALAKKLRSQLLRDGYDLESGPPEMTDIEVFGRAD